MKLQTKVLLSTGEMEEGRREGWGEDAGLFSAL